MNQTPINEAVELEKFQQWWNEHGQYCRAGGGSYEETFAWRAWQARAALPPPIVEPVKMPPSGYAYRYPDGYIRFTNGEEINGSRPAEAVPYYFGAIPSTPTSAPSDGAADARALADECLSFVAAGALVQNRADEWECAICGEDIREQLHGHAPDCLTLRARASNSDTVNYKLLLAKYIEHVGAEEGSTSIDELYRGSNDKWRGMSDRVEFDQLEKEALEEAEKFYLHASTHTTTGGENA